MASQGALIYRHAEAVKALKARAETLAAQREIALPPLRTSKDARLKNILQIEWATAVLDMAIGSGSPAEESEGGEDG